MTATRRHFIIPDTQVRLGVPTDHLDWVGRAIKEYDPDVVIHLGDHWDLESLSTWSGAGSLQREGLRYLDDITAGNEAMSRLGAAMAGWKGPKIILRGNHEDRLTRRINVDPVWERMIGSHQFNDASSGWEVVDYVHGSPGVKNIDGIAYAHFFANPNTGKPISGTIAARLAKIGQSFVQGHAQGLQQGNVQYATGHTRNGIVAGSCYMHDEPYKGLANRHWRGVVVLNEVRNGTFSEMPLTLDYLCRKYEGRSLSSFLTRNYRRAKERFTCATPL